MSRIFRHAVGICSAILIIGFIALFVRLWWVGSKPQKASWLPSKSVWISGPHTPLEFHRVGEWVGCSPENHETALCWFTDDKGSITFRGQFVSLNAHQINDLTISQGDMADFTMLSKKRNTYVRIVRLENGDILAPVEALGELKIKNSTTP
jgi:hypothetical protein